MSTGVRLAYDDFIEVLESLGDFLFLTKEKKAIRLRNMKKHRDNLVTSFVKNLDE